MFGGERRSNLKKVQVYPMNYRRGAPRGVLQGGPRTVRYPGSVFNSNKHSYGRGAQHAQHNHLAVGLIMVRRSGGQWAPAHRKITLGVKIPDFID